MQAGKRSMLQDFKWRFVVSSLLTIPILLLSPIIQTFLNFSFVFLGDKFVLFGLATLIYFYGGKPFLLGLVEELKNKRPGMMTLVAVAITAAFFYSAFVVLGLSGKLFFWELATLIDVMLLGHYIEMRSLKGASISIENLAKVLPAEAHLILEDGSIKDVKIAELKKDDRILVKPGEKIAADGKIVEGESQINEAALTGEALPVYKAIEDKVLGGAINGDGALTIVVEKPGADSYLASVVDLVNKTISSKSKAQSLADKAAFVLTIIALSLGVVTFFVWFYFESISFALERAVTVMVITCPHALGVAVPLVISGIVVLAARRSLLIKNKTAFENAHKVDVIVFDKTGTLTKGELGVVDVVALKKLSLEEILSYAAALEVKATHGIAEAIVKEAEKQNLEIPQVLDFKQISGQGVLGNINNEEIAVGNKKILEQLDFSSDEARKSLEDSKKIMRKMTSKGKVVVFVAGREGVFGIIVFEDNIREESKKACQILKDRGYEVAMITGDNKATANAVAKELGLDNVLAEVLPDKKASKIRSLQRKGRRVAMVGDGINDAPALAQADVGIAIGAGTDVAIETADVILVKNDPRNVVDIVDLSRITKRKLVENLVWATGYNVVALPLAAGVLYSYGIVLQPAVGAVLMAVSTIVVIINSRLLFYRRKY